MFLTKCCAVIRSCKFLKCGPFHYYRLVLAYKRPVFRSSFFFLFFSFLFFSIVRNCTVKTFLHKRIAGLREFQTKLYRVRRFPGESTKGKSLSECYPRSFPQLFRMVGSFVLTDENHPLTRRTFVTVRPTAFRPVEPTIRPWETESAADLSKVQYPWKRCIGHWRKPIFGRRSPD